MTLTAVPRRLLSRHFSSPSHRTDAHPHPDSDDKPGDQRAPHDSGEEVSLHELERLGVKAFPGIDLEGVEKMCVQTLGRAAAAARIANLG